MPWALTLCFQDAAKFIQADIVCQQEVVGFPTGRSQFLGGGSGGTGFWSTGYWASLRWPTALGPHGEAEQLYMPGLKG